MVFKPPHSLRKPAFGPSRPTKVLLVFGFPSKNHVLTRGNGQEDIFLAIFGGKPLLSKSNQFTQQQPIGTPWVRARFIKENSFSLREKARMRGG
jgi:hypothetical protein